MTNQEALDIFVSCATLDCEHCNMSFRGCEDKPRFTEMRDMVISALEHQLANGWIPVEKELPKFTDDYLVSVTISTSFGDFDTVRTLPFYRRDGKGGWLLPENFDEVWKVRAWRELPEPYKEEMYAGRN